MRITRKRFINILLSIFAVSFVVVGVMVLIFTTIGGKKDNKQDNVVELAYSYSANSTYVVSSPTSYSLNTSDKTAKFTGLTGSDYTDIVSKGGNVTVIIPDTISDGSTSYTVTDMGMVVGSGTTKAEEIELITGLEITNNVKHIDPAAFAGLFKLEYLSTPFVGEERGSDANSGENARPFGYMFSVGFNDRTGGINSLKKVTYSSSTTPLHKANGLTEYDLGYDETASDPFANINVSPGNTGGSSSHYLYESVEFYTGDTPPVSASKVYYLMPAPLKVVKITDDTSLPDRAFYECSHIEQLYLSDTLVDLNHLSIFAEMSKLHYVKLPETANSLGQHLFANDTLLGKVSNPNYPQENGTPVKITVPNNIIVISKGCFEQCFALENIRIPATVKTISDGAFKNCNTLKNVIIYGGSGDIAGKTEGLNIPESLEVIEKEAFRGCDLFKEVNLVQTTRSLKVIGDAAFGQCSQIQKITLPFVGRGEITNTSSDEQYAFGYIFGTTSSGSGFYSSDEGSGTYQIPSSLKNVVILTNKNIGGKALNNLKEVTSLTIDGDLTEIGAGALDGAEKLKYLVIPFASYKRTGGGRLSDLFGTKDLGSKFYEANGRFVPVSLQEIEVTNQPVIYSGTFHNITSAIKIQIDKPTQTIQEGSFYNNQGLTELVLPFIGEHRGVETSYWWGYDDDWRNTLSWIFNHTGTGVSTSFPNSYYNDIAVVYHGRRAHIPNKLTTLTITDDTAIAWNGLRNFKSLTNVKILGEPSYISEGALINCYNLQSIELPYIGRDMNPTGASGNEHSLGYIFGNFGTNSYGCHYGYTLPNSLKNVKINNVQTVPNFSFQNAKSVQTVELIGQIAVLGDYAFDGCTSLKTLKNFGAIYDKVGNYAFRNCLNITDLYTNSSNYVIPTTVKVIGDYAFYNTGISDTEFNNSDFKIERAGAYSYGGNYNIESVNVPATVAVGEGIFAGCKNLTQATLAPGKVSKYMFRDCVSLPAINLQGVTTSIPEGMFYNCASLMYQEATDPAGSGLSQDTSTVSIGPYAFYNCYSMDTFKVMGSTTYIGHHAFYGCKGFESMIMPRNVQIIEPNAWDACEEGFHFYVYDPQEDWPTGWVNNWNCYWPVYLLGAADDSIFTYEYDATTRSYMITGVVAGPNSLSGIIILPSYRQGLKVTGIKTGSLNSQPSVTQVVIPKSFLKVEPSSVDTGAKIELFFEDTLAQANAKGITKLVNETHFDDVTKGYYMDLSISPYQITIGEEERNWLSKGIIYYGDYWEYITNGTIKYPALKADKFIVTINKDYIVTYDGSAHNPQPDGEYEIVSIKTKGIKIGNQESSEFTDEFPLKMFSYTYQDNIKAGTAKVKATVIPNELIKFNDKFGDYSNINLRRENLRIVGTATGTYTIHKKQIILFYDGAKFEKDYDTLEWRFGDTDATRWTDNNVQGLEGANYTFSGVLATRSANAGTYESEAPVGNVTTDLSGTSFYWRSSWNVYLYGYNVTENFEVKIGGESTTDYDKDGKYDGPLDFDQRLKVTIHPLDVIADFTGGEWWESTPPGTKYYLYQYNGGVINPTAAAYRYKSWHDNQQMELVSLATMNVTNTYTGPNTTMFPTFDPATGTALAYNGSYPGPFGATAVLADQNNYHLVDKDGNDIPNITCDYQVVRAKIKLVYNNKNYVIGEDDDNWELNNFAPYMTGLATGSIIEGTLVNVDSTGNKSNAKGDYIWDGESNKIVFDTQKPFSKSAYTNLEDYYIWRAFDNAQGWILENDYYEPLVIDAYVRINYNQFDVKYYITDDTIPNSKYLVTGVAGIDGANNPILKFTWETEGHEWYNFIAEAANVKSSLNATYVKYKYGVTIDTTTPLRFKEVLDSYAVGVEISRKNYDTYYKNCYINVIKSSVRIGSLTREYNAQYLDPFAENKVLKYDKLGEMEDGTIIDAKPTFVYYLKSDTNYLNPLTQVKEVGQYVAHVVSPETKYYNAYDQYIDFEITKRKLDINVSQAPVYDSSSNIIGYGQKDYDKQIFEWQEANGDSTNGYPKVLPGHQLIFRIQTPDSVVGSYSGSSFVIKDSGIKILDTTTFEDVTSNYDISIVGTFKINELKITYDVFATDDTGQTVSVKDGSYTRQWDGNSYSVDVVITTPDPTTYTPTPLVYFTNQAITAANDTPTTIWNLNPTYYTTPGVYDIYYKVVADCYTTEYGHTTITIEPREMNVELQFDGNASTEEKEIWWDDLDHAFSVVVNDPSMFYTVTYELKLSNDPLKYDTPTSSPILCRDFEAPDQPKVYEVRITIKADNYVTKVFNTKLTIKPSNGPDSPLKLTKADVTIQNYTGQYDQSAHTLLGVSVGDPAIQVFYSADGSTWEEGVAFTSANGAPVTGETHGPEYTNAGTYPVYVMIKRIGYAPYVTNATDGNIGEIKIDPLQFDQNEFSMQTYGGIYDGKFHNVLLNVGNYGVSTDPKYLADLVVEYSNYYTDSTHNAIAEDSGWGPLISVQAKNVGGYKPIYAKVSAPNYQSIFFTFPTITASSFTTLDSNETNYEGSIVISKVKYPNKMTFDLQEIQYQKVAMKDSDIDLTKLKDTVTNAIIDPFIHDGVGKFRYYTAIETSPGVYQAEYDNPIPNPSELGLYFVEIKFDATNNCSKADISGFFRIVPKVLEVKYDKKVEYLGVPQYPYPKVETGTGDTITIINTLDLSVIFGGQTEPVEIGKYYFDLTTLENNPNYVLDTYRIEFEIIPFEVLIKGYIEYDYDGYIWKKIADWEDYIFIHDKYNNWMPGNVLTNLGHSLDLEMHTLRAARDTYYLIDDGTGPINRNGLFATVDVLDSSSNSVLSNYHFTYDFTVKIVLPKLEDIETPDVIVDYDGNSHDYVITLPSSIIQGKVTYSESANGEYFNSFSRVLGGEYTVYIKLEGRYYEPTIKTAKLIIKPIDLDVKINPLNQVYDAQSHKHDFSATATTTDKKYYIDNVNNMPQAATFFKYYKKDEYNKDDLEALYKAGVNEYSPIVISGLDELVNAGEYYAVCYYEETTSWKREVTIEEVELERKPIRIKLPVNYSGQVKDYDGYPFKISLSGAQFVKNGAYASGNGSDDLIPGHVIAVSNINICSIQTKSANAGFYDGATDFLFANFRIQEYAGGPDVTQNYRPQVESPLDVTINKIPFTFTVDDHTREYIADYIAKYNVWEERLADPIVHTPDETNPLYFFDNQIHYHYYSVDALGNPVSFLGTDDQVNVGKYYVVVTFDEGTNFLAYTALDKAAIVEITPMEIEVIWDNLETTFNNTLQEPTAKYVDALQNEVALDVTFVDSAIELAGGALKAGYYEVLVQFKYGEVNYMIPASEGLRDFRIKPKVYTIDIGKKITSNTESGYSEDLITANIPDWNPDITVQVPGTPPHNALIVMQETTQGVYDGSSIHLLDGYEIINQDNVLLNDSNDEASIQFEFEGRVTVVPKEIQYEIDPNNVFIYDGSEHGYLDLLNVIYPTEDYLIEYKLQGDDTWKTIKSGVENVGIYNVDFRITATGFTKVEGSLSFEIVKANAKLNARIDSRNYNGNPINSSNILFVGSGKDYNGKTTDLYYELYKVDGNKNIISGLLNATTGVTDAGKYMMIIRSYADVATSSSYVANSNYYALEEKIYFEIYPLSLTIELDIDKEVANAAALANQYVKQLTNDPSFKGLGTDDALTYEISTSAGGVAQGMKRGKFSYNGKFDPALLPLSNDITAEGTSYVTGLADTLPLNFTWKVMSTTRVDGSNNLIETSQNYIVELKFNIDIHYPKINYTLPNVSFNWDGNKHYGTVTFNNPTTGVTQNYWTAGNEGTPSSAISDSPVSFDNPGVYIVKYKFEAPNFEIERGQYSITIKNKRRTGDPANAHGMDKIYDGFPAGTGTNVGGTTLYLPNYGLLYPDGGGDDDTDFTKIAITFNRKGYNEELDMAIDAGTYEYKLTIPASQNGFYGETILRGTFTISRQKLYLTGTYTTGYTGNSVEVLHDDTGASGFTSKMMYNNDSTQLVSMPTGVYIFGLIRSNASGIGEYRLNYNEAYWVPNGRVTYRVYNSSSGTAEDVTSNYDVVSDVIIKITKGEIVVEYDDTHIEYDGLAHTSVFNVIRPLAVTRYYSTDGENWDTTPIRYIPSNSSPYVIYVKLTAPNYVDKVITTNLYIHKATTTFEIPDLSKDYDAIEVLLPHNYVTNNTEVTRDQLNQFGITDYYQESPIGSNNWIAMGNNRPVNIGHYYIEVKTPETENFKAGVFTKDFWIRGKLVDVAWNLPSGGYTYNGQPQGPTAIINVPSSVGIIYTYTPLVNTTDPNHTDYGTYRVTAMLNQTYENYILNPTQYSVVYTIKKRPATIVIKWTEIFDGNIKSYTYQAVPTGGTPSAGTFYATNLVDTQTISGTASTSYHEVGTYNLLGTEIDTNGNPKKIVWTSGDPTVRDLAGNDVTNNYILKHDYKVLIDYGSLIIPAIDKVFEYDGQYHSTQADVLNAANYRVEYATNPNGPYSTTPPMFKNVGVHSVYYNVYNPENQLVKGYSNGDTTCYGTVTITQKQSNLIVDPVNDKIYDGVGIANPNVTYEDYLTSPREVKYTHYKLDSSGNWIETTYRMDVGKYKVKVQLLADENNNYSAEEVELPYEITKKDLIIFVGSKTNTTYTSIPQTMVYNLYPTVLDTGRWEHTITNDNAFGIVNGDQINGTVETKLTIVGNYNDPSDFEWKNQYTLRRPLGNVDVKDNYNIIFDLHVQILPADIDYNSFGYIGEYDGAGHKISVTVNAPLTFLIEYSEDNVTYSTAPIVKSAIGEYTVYFKITAPNCKEVISSNIIKINPASSAPGPASIDPRLYFNPKYTYDLNPYMTGDLQKNHPYLTEIPNGVKQVITYYNASGVEIGKEEFIPGVTDVYNTLSGYKPVNVGIYYFKIEVDAYTDGNGSHPAETVGLQSFFIVSDGTPYPPNNPSYYPPDENGGLIEFVPIWEYDADEYMHTDSHKNPWYKGSLVYDEVIVKYYDEADTALANEIPHPINVGYYKFTLELKNAGTSVYVSNPQKFYITGNGTPSGPTPGGGSGTGTNNGNVYYIPEYEYDGGLYMNNDSSYTDPHYVGTLSTGAQTVTYYAGTDTGCTTPISKPTDVGEYIFVINIAADSTYPAFSSNPQSFKIVPHVITVTWTDTVVTYDGTPQTAKATGVDDLNGNATINFDVIIAETNVGTYTNQALFPATFTNASNYKIDPNTATSPFEIKPKKIDKPVYENLTFMYFRDEIRIELDVPDPANLPNTVAVVAVLDSTGAVIELRKKSDDSVFDAAPDLGYKFQIIKGDANADVTVLAFALSEQHQFIATLDDPNYVWSDSNDKVAFTTVFTIIPYDFDDPTALYQLVVTPQNAFEIYTGTAFAQIPTVERVEIANTTNRFTLVDTTTAPRYKEYDVAYPGDHTNVGFATIEVTCCNNYIGTAQATYEIKAKPPALLEIEDGTSQGATGPSPFVFMNVGYNSTLNQLDLDEEWSVTGTNVRDAAAVANTSNHFVLNHVHQKLNVDQILAQFKNDVNYLEILDKTGNVMSKGGIAYVGTGCKVVLYDDTNIATRNIVDEIEIVIYGDVNGDGVVDANDVGAIANSLNNSYVYGDGNFSECQYMAMMVYREDGSGNAIKKIDATQVGKLANALNASDDININYVI